MANLKDLTVNGSARILGALYAPDIKNTSRITEFIVGTQTASTGSWTGKTQDTVLYDGKNINYFLPYAGSGNASLNLTLSNGTTTGAKPVYLWGTSYVTTHYPVNSCINMTYNATKGAWFVNADRDVNDINRLWNSNVIKAATAITANTCIVGTKDGYKTATANVTFDITYPIMWANSAISASGTGNNNVYAFPDRTLTNNKAGWTGTQYSIAYLVGTLSGTTFTIDSAVVTTTAPTTADGKVYTPIGVTYSTTNIYFYPTNTYYAYRNGSFQPLQPDVDIDNTTITKNAFSKLQTVAVKDNRSGNAIKTWTGTKAQYDEIVTKDSNTLYNITDDTDVTLSLLELLYPVGAIYIGTCASCPLQVLGVGTWQLIASDRVLQGAGTRGIVGDTLEAGLPNITSGTDWLNSTGGTLTNATNTTPSLDGCFDGVSTGGHGISSNNYSIHWSRIDASRSSTIYKNDVTTVQPPAYVVNIWERIS